MTDDIIRKATTADYIETIDNLRAEVKRLRSQSVEQVFRRKNEELAAKDAYIKRLEAAFLDSEIERLNNPDNNHSWYPGDESYVDFVNRVKREAEQKAREALERIKEGKG